MKPSQLRPALARRGASLPGSVEEDSRVIGPSVCRLKSKVRDDGGRRQRQLATCSYLLQTQTRTNLNVTVPLTSKALLDSLIPADAPYQLQP